MKRAIVVLASAGHLAMSNASAAQTTSAPTVSDAHRFFRTVMMNGTTRFASQGGNGTSGNRWQAVKIDSSSCASTLIHSIDQYRYTVRIDWKKVLEVRRNYSNETPGIRIVGGIKQDVNVTGIPDSMFIDPVSPAMEQRLLRALKFVHETCREDDGPF